MAKSTVADTAQGTMMCGEFWAFGNAETARKTVWQLPCVALPRCDFARWLSTA